MKKHSINTNHAPKAIGPYSQGIITGSLLYTSGQIPINPETGLIVEGIEAQTKQVLENLKAIIEEAGADMKSVIKTTVFIQDMNEFAALNDVYATFFEEPYPARSTVQVGRLPKDVRVEIEAIVQLPAVKF